MGGKSRARRAALFAPYLRPVGVIDGDRLACEQRDLFRVEKFRQKQPAFAIKIIDLLLSELHGGSSRVLSGAAHIVAWRKGYHLTAALPATSTAYCDAEIGWIATISKPRFRTKR